MDIISILADRRVNHLTSGNQHCRPGWVQIDCPWCGNDSHKFHLGWNIAGNYANCWKCGPHSAFSVLVKLGLTPKDASDALKTSPARTSARIEHDSSGSYTEPAGLGKLLRIHRRYLIKRLFSPDEIEALWEVSGIGLAPRLSWRLFIPITLNGERVSWTTRSVSDTAPRRYISASKKEETQNHKRLVYGSDFCRDTIVAVEGPIDAWRVGPGAGALFGVSYTTAQVEKLAKYPKRFICFDNSRSAQAQAEKLASELSAFDGKTSIIQLDAEDPGSASKKEIRLLRKACKL